MTCCCIAIGQGRLKRRRVVHESDQAKAKVSKAAEKVKQTLHVFLCILSCLPNQNFRAARVRLNTDQEYVRGVPILTTQFYRSMTCACGLLLLETLDKILGATTTPIFCILRMTWCILCELYCPLVPRQDKQYLYAVISM